VEDCLRVQVRLLPVEMLDDEPLEGILDSLVTVDLLTRALRVFDGYSDDVAHTFLIQPVEKILHVFATEGSNLAYPRLELFILLNVGLTAL
jgi:hypothetical protein